MCNIIAYVIASLHSYISSSIDEPFSTNSLTLIRGDSLTLCPIRKHTDSGFKDICHMYQIEEADLVEQLNDTVLWVIYDESANAVGVIQIDTYKTLFDLEKQVSDSTLATILFSREITFELSYSLVEKYQGKGIGSKAVQLWMAYAARNNWDKRIFAVADKDNKASIRILEKNGFSFLGYFTHKESQDEIVAYIGTS